MIGPFARTSLKAVVLGASLALAALTGTATAQTTIILEGGTLQPMPIAVPRFAGGDLGAQIAQVIAADLERSGLFRPVPAGSHPQTPEQIQAQPAFPSWRGAGAEALVAGRVVPQGNKVSFEFRLWDVQAEQQLTGTAFTADAANWRRVAHIIADTIYKKVTGEEGYFDTRIVYVSESGPKNRRVKRLAIMDQDGANHRFLTSGKDLVMTPRFSPRDQTITYMSYFNDKPRVYLFNIDSGQQEVLGDFPGMTFAPRFSPDGNTVVMSMAKDGNTDIFSVDLRTRRISRLTSGPAIDTSPSFSPDGSRIVYNSDQSGGQQLYVMSASGGGGKRISFGDGRYATPVWSPRGDYIAFTKIKGGRFSIGVMKPDGSGERILTESFLDEGPTWAPNGRVIAFFRQSPGAAGTVKLYTVDVTGRNERLVPTPLDGSDPAWSPLNP
ncbi:Tol-Pal system beta propeller repeat protein TolB [Zavarzinia compransoris]|uniref:Tol-Pal system protein TolB n=1 Tax=Zavarzinia compransoris TaxID=1264899 RepID=A0A317E6K2_9PROT|nr:Tol-Pal system beta propeller repeat protein TolB [Zavarzinia compransoris]PWR22251.1 Tol-Pal system protein TolB [Zavarzinia compransoris]TDP46990.1 TolB protein [Zavarzinia compransoris]